MDQFIDKVINGMINEQMIKQIEKEIYKIHMISTPSNVSMIFHLSSIHIVVTLATTANI